MDGRFDRLQGDEDEGLTLPDLMEMPDDLRRVLNALIRMGGCTVADLCARLQIDQDEARALLQKLAGERLVQKTLSDEGETIYRTRYATKRRSRLPGKLLDALDDAGADDDAP